MSELEDGLVDFFLRPTLESSSDKESCPAPPPQLGFAAEGVNEQIGFTEEKLQTLRRTVNDVRSTIGALGAAVAGMSDTLKHSGGELNTARKRITELERINASLVKEARRQKKRADEAQGADEVKLEISRCTASTITDPILDRLYGEHGELTQLKANVERAVLTLNSKAQEAVAAKALELAAGYTVAEQILRCALGGEE